MASERRTLGTTKLQPCTSKILPLEHSKNRTRPEWISLPPSLAAEQMGLKSHLQLDQFERKFEILQDKLTRQSSTRSRNLANAGHSSVLKPGGRWAGRQQPLQCALTPPANPTAARPYFTLQSLTDLPSKAAVVDWRVAWGRLREQQPTQR